jgi:hypothetical protein
MEGTVLLRWFATGTVKEDQIERKERGEERQPPFFSLMRTVSEP